MFKFQLLDAQVYASWGVDYLKNDDCYVHPSTPIMDSYRTMHESLRSVNRPIIHSIKGSVSIPQADLVSHMRRVGVDIGDDWALVMHLVDVYIHDMLWRFSHPGFWNDLDMLEIGNAGLTHDENVAHLALWCAFKAPLLLGNDLATMDDETLELLKHPGLIAINQDSLGEAVRWVKSESSTSDGGQSLKRVVSDACDKTDDNQKWRYTTETQHLVHVHTESCLSRDPDNYLTVQKCANTPAQHWSLDKDHHQIHPATDQNNWCLTMSREQFGEAKVRSCDERVNHLDWQGPVQSYMGIQESFRFLTSSDKSSCIFQNKNNGCLSVGGKEELMFFIGRLSGGRLLIVVVNRDTVEHNIFLDYSIFTELDNHTRFDVTDALTGAPIESEDIGFSTTLKGHYVLVAILK